MKLQDEMFVIEQRQGNVDYLRLTAGHTIYKAHFPGNPITPGVCLVQIVMELLQSRLQVKLALRKITNLKFIAPISPVQCPVIDVNFLEIAESVVDVKTKGTILSKEKAYTKFSLIFEKV